MGAGDDDLNAKLLDAAKKRVGTKAVMKDHYGKDCFVLVDMLLRQIGAATAADGDVKVTPTADYDWGDGIMLDHIEPGDILQFKKHLIHIETDTYDENDKLIKQSEVWLTRPHHCAIVESVNDDGSYTIIEQNVHPNPDKVNRNTIPGLEDGLTSKTVKVGNTTQKIKITITGGVSAYHPIPKPEKGAMLRHSLNGVRALASFMPADGGPKRPPGPFSGTGAPGNSGHSGLA